MCHWKLKSLFSINPTIEGLFCFIAPIKTYLFKARVAVWGDTDTFKSLLIVSQLFCQIIWGCFSALKTNRFCASVTIDFRNYS